MLTRITVVGLTTLLLIGCGSLTKSNEPAISTWWLEPLAANAVSGIGNSEAEQQTQKVLVTIDVIPGLDTAAILTLSPDAELNRFSGARWAGSLPELLRSLVSRSLDGSGQFEVVTRSNNRDLDRCELRLQVRAFYAELSASGNAEDIRIVMSGEYDCKGGPHHSLVFDQRVTVQSDRMVGIVAAFQSGLNQILNDMIGQIQQAD